MSNDGAKDSKNPKLTLQIVQKSWPTLSVDETEFGHYLADRQLDASTVAPTVAADLYLAFACGMALPGSLQAFRIAYGPLVAGVCRVFDPNPEFGEDIMQKVCEALFVGKEGKPPRIAQYRGQGSLAGWVRTTAKRIALRTSRRGDALVQMADDTLANELAVNGDFDITLIKLSHKEFLRQVITEALKASPDRRMIQLVFLGGISMSQVGKMYGISQSSVSRRLKTATTAIMDCVLAAVKTKFGLEEQEADSFLGLFRSQLDLQILLSDDQS